MPRRSLPVARLTFLAICAGSTPGQIPQPETSTQVRKEFVLGQLLSKDVERRDGSIDDPVVLGYVQQVADRLARAAGGRSLRVHITRGSGIYASLLPRGVFYISGAMFERLENEAEVAGLLAHQLAHEEARKQRQIRRQKRPKSSCSRRSIGSSGWPTP